MSLASKEMWIFNLLLNLEVNLLDFVKLRENARDYIAYGQQTNFFYKNIFFMLVSGQKSNA